MPRFHTEKSTCMYIVMTLHIWKSSFSQCYQVKNQVCLGSQGPIMLCFFHLWHMVYCGSWQRLAFHPIPILSVNATIEYSVPGIFYYSVCEVWLCVGDSFMFTTVEWPSGWRCHCLFLCFWVPIEVLFCLVIRDNGKMKIPCVESACTQNLSGCKISMA